MLFTALVALGKFDAFRKLSFYTEMLTFEKTNSGLWQKIFITIW